MRHKLTFVFYCLLSVLLISCSHDNSKQIFHDTNGKTVQLANLQGKWVVVNVWASWCDGCIKEIPELNHFYQTRPGDVEIFGVNFDQLPLDMLQKAIQTAKIAFPVLISNPGSAWHLDDVSVLPTTFILNPHGKVVKVIIGTSTAKSLSAVLQQLRAAV